MKKLLKKTGLTAVGILSLLILTIIIVYAVPTYRFNRADPVPASSADSFSSYCKTGPEANSQEQDCYEVCKPLEAEVNEALSISAVDQLKQQLGSDLAPLLDVCLPFVELQEYQVLDRNTGEISPQSQTKMNQLFMSLLYGQATCPPLMVTPYGEVMPVLSSTMSDPTTGVTIKEFTRSKFQEQTFAAGPINNDIETAPLQICTFIKQYDIDLNRVPNPVSSFTTMNDFFAREIDLTSKPIDQDPATVSSPADSKVVVYPTISEAQMFWIKGEAFNLDLFLDEGNANFSERYQNPTIALFRLAVDDYHRFHAPLSGELLQTHWVEAGDFFSVQPIALHNPAVSVLSENRRVIIEIENSEIGPYLMIPVGATEVGSIVLEDVSEFAKGDEVGHFEFGGSLVALVFPDNTITFDEDLLQASQQAVEARVQVGEQVGVLASSEE